VRPVKLLVKVPVPIPSEVLLSAVVGLCDVLQQTPLTVIVPPPSAVILPPDFVEFEVIEVTSAVVIVALTTELVVNDTSLP
jgi:hypothetical protein